MNRPHLLSGFGKICILCNLCFVLALILRYRRFTENHDIETVIVLLGWSISPVLNLLSTLFWPWRQMRLYAKWIFVTNFILLLIQIILFLFYFK